MLEELSYSDPSVYWEAKDINSTGTVVGTLYPSGDVYSGQDTELAAGVIWQPGSSVAQTKVAAPFLATTPAGGQPVQVRGTRFNAITEAGTIFGGIYTGWGYGSLITAVPNPIVNYYRWSANGTGAQALTRGTASLVGYYGPWPIARLNGAVAAPSEYAAVRANATGHYVGRMLVPGVDPSSPVETGMVDGRSVTYHPWDINESGMVAAFSEDYNDMVVINADGTRRDIAGANPAAINAFVRPGVDSQGEAKAIPAPQIIGWWFKDYVSGWLPSVWEYAPNGEWTVHSLDELISNSAGWFIPNFNVQDINDEGVIVGYGDFTDPTNPQAQQEGHGFMLVPIGFYARDKTATVTFKGNPVELPADGINHGFDPRPGTDSPWPWASVVKGGISNVVKLVLPANAQMVLVVLGEDGNPTSAVQAMLPEGGLMNGDNLVELTAGTGTPSVTRATVEVRVVNTDGSETGEVLAKLNVMALPPQKVSLGIYRIQASTSEDQEVGGPSNAEIKALLDDVYKQAGIEFEIVTAQSPPIIVAYDTYNSPPAAIPGDGLVQPDEYDWIVSDSRVAAGKIRVFLAANSGVAKDDAVPPDQTEFARGHTPAGTAYSFVFTKTGHNSNLIATLNVAHELGHVLQLSVAALLDNADHDLGPFPPETTHTFGGVMHPGKGTDQPGLWLPHEDWEQANIFANNFLYP